MENKNEELETFEYDGEIHIIDTCFQNSIITTHNEINEEYLQLCHVKGVFLKKWFNHLYNNICIDDVYKLYLYKIHDKNMINNLPDSFCMWRFRVDNLDLQGTYHTLMFPGNSVFYEEVSLNIIYINDDEN